MSWLTSRFSFRRKHSPTTPRQPSAPERHRAGRGLRVEALEDRQMLSATLVQDINPSGNSNPVQFANVNGTLYFSAQDSALPRRSLYQSDGTASGTRHFFPTWVAAQPTSVNGTLYFVSSPR